MSVLFPAFLQRVRPRCHDRLVSAFRRLPSPASESGVISAGAVITVALGILFLYLLLAAFKGDPAYYGSVPIPSKGAPIELDSGEISVSYAENIPASGVPLNAPSDLSYTVKAADGTEVQVDSRGGEPEDSKVGTSRIIGSASIPADGTYFVDADSTDVAGRVSPSIAFGQSPIGAVKERLNDVIDKLKGPVGIGVLVVLAILFLIPYFERAQVRRNRPPMH
jgi:hypothetical protein